MPSKQKSIDGLFSFKKGRSGRKVRPKDSLICAEIYPHSPAERAGLKVGDHLGIVNKGPASLLGAVTSFWPVEDSYSYRFIDQNGDEILVESSLSELGIRYEKTTPAIDDTYDARRHIYEDLILLWERQEWSLLKELAAEQMHFFNQTGWLQRKLSAPKCCESPATLLYGLALIELGKMEKGESFVEQFVSEHLHKWTSDIHALFEHHQAKKMVSRGEIDAARELSRETHRLHRFKSTVAWHRATFNEEPPRLFSDDSQVTHFPGVALRPLDGKSPLALPDFAAGTEPGKWNVFICLASYRGNGPYNELMGTFGRNRELLTTLFSPPIVITEEEERRADRPHWYAEEDHLAESSVPFRVMLDQNDLALQLGTESTPDVFVVDRDLKILYRGPMDNHNLWKAVGRALRMSV